MAFFVVTVVFSIFHFTVEEANWTSEAEAKRLDFDDDMMLTHDGFLFLKILLRELNLQDAGAAHWRHSMMEQ